MQKRTRQVIVRRKAGGRADRMEAAELTKGRRAGRECSKQTKTEKEVKKARRHADMQTGKQADRQISSRADRKERRDLEKQGTIQESVSKREKKL